MDRHNVYTWASSPARAWPPRVYPAPVDLPIRSLASTGVLYAEADIGPGTGRICLIRSVVVRTLPIGGAVNAA